MRHAQELRSCYINTDGKNTDEMTTSLSPLFIQTMNAAVGYWRGQTAGLDDARIGWLDRERQNLYRVVAFGLQRLETWPAAAEVALQAFDLVERRGYGQQWIPILETAVARCGNEHHELKCRLLNRLGFFYRQERRLDAAVAMHQEAETLARAVGDRQGLAEAFYYLGGDYLEKRAYAEAERCALAALAAFDELENVERWLAWSYMLLGIIARNRGDLEAAAAHLREAVARWRALMRTAPLARTLNDLGNALWPAGQVTEAEACFVEAACLLGPTAYELDKTLTQLSLGTFYYHQQQWGKAESAFRHADSLYLRQSGHVVYQAHVANNLGSVLLKRGYPAEAEYYLRRALHLWQQAGDDVPRANTLGTLGQALAAQGQAATALTLFEEAIALLQPYPDDYWAGRLIQDFTAERETLKNSQQ